MAVTVGDSSNKQKNEGGKSRNATVNSARSSDAAVNFFADLKNELGKVVWPTRSDTIRSTIAVIGVMVVAVIIVSGLDFGFSKFIMTVK